MTSHNPAPFPPLTTPRPETERWPSIYTEFRWGEAVTKVGNHQLYRGSIGREAIRCLLLPIPSTYFPTREDLVKFTQGMQAIQQLTAHSLLRILGVGHSQGSVCICYEDFSGGPLTQLHAKLPKAELVLSILSEVARGLHAAHIQGISHLDVNAGWILFTPEGKTKIAGLGLAALLPGGKKAFYEASLTRPPELRTTVAPEYMKEELPLSFQTDLYGLGSIAYRMLTGECVGGFVMLPSSRRQVGIFIDNVIFKALAPDPQQRQETAEKFAEDIPRIGAGVDNSHIWLEVEVEQQRVKQRKQLKRMQWAVGLAAVALATAGIYKLHTYQEAQKAEQAAGATTSVRNQMKSLRGLLGKNETESAIVLIGVIMQKIAELPAARERTELSAALLPTAIKLGQEEAMIKHLSNIKAETPEDTPDFQRIGHLTSLLTEGKTQYNLAMEAGRLAKEAGNEALAQVEFARAQAFLPNHPGVVREWSKLEIDTRQTIAKALAPVHLPNGSPLPYGLHINGLSVYLDLANNPTLTDISFLKGLPITSLDLSNTGVQDLESIGDLPLNILHLDRTKVTSLAPLRSASLRVLTAEGNEIVGHNPLLDSVFMENYRFGVADKKEQEKTQPVMESNAWVNHLGMIFTPLQGSSNVFLSKWETRLIDYRNYAEANRIPVPTGMVCPKDKDGNIATWEEKPFSWLHAPKPQDLNHPVVGINFIEANAFCSWLTRKSQELLQIPSTAYYRLPTSQEWTRGVGWEVGQVARPNTKAEEMLPLYPWGTDWPPTASVGNYPTGLLEGDGKTPAVATAEVKAFPYTAPVGSFRNTSPHRDMGGNVREWVVGANLAPALRDASCLADTRYFEHPQEALKLDAESTPPVPGIRDATVGFRVVLALDQ